MTESWSPHQIPCYASRFHTANEDPNDSPSAGLLKALNLISLAVALVTLLAAIGLVIWRSAFL